MATSTLVEGGVKPATSSTWVEDGDIYAPSSPAAGGTSPTPPLATVVSASPSGATTPPTFPRAQILAMPSAPNKELRRSIRNAALADVNTLHKAKWLAAKKNLELPGYFQRSILATLLGPVAA